MDCLQRFVAAERIFAAQLTGVGAFSDVVLMYFDWEKKEYQCPDSEVRKYLAAHSHANFGIKGTLASICF